MAQFPISDQQGLIDGLNYVLSGPGSLGQSFQGYSSSVTAPITGDIVDPNTGFITSGLPITTSYLQYYVTDCMVEVGVSGGTDRVLLSGQVNIDFNYTTEMESTIEYTVAINRYTAFPNTTNTVADYLFFGQKTIASHTYTYSAPTSSYGLRTVTASGTKIAYTPPASGTFNNAVDYYAINVNATTGTGVDAKIEIKIAYGAAGSYNDDNTIMTVIDGGRGSSWAIGDTIVIDGADLGGVSGVNDLTLTVTGVTADTPTISQETIFSGILDEQPELGFYLYVIELQWYGIIPSSITIDSGNMNVRSITAQVVKQ